MRVSKSAVDILSELDNLLVKAAAAHEGADDDKSRASSSHPTATAPNQTESLKPGARASENSEDSKTTAGGPMAVDATKAGPAAGTGQESPMNRLGMNPKATGEAPEVEGDYKDTKDDPGVRGRKSTTSPAKVGDEKFGSLQEKGLSLLNDINVALGNELAKQAAEGPAIASNAGEDIAKETKSKAGIKPIKLETKKPKGKEVGAPEMTTAAPVDAGEPEAQKEAEAGAQAAADLIQLTKEAQEELTIKLASAIYEDAVAAGAKLAEFMEGFQTGAQKSAEGIPPELAQDLGAAGGQGGAPGADPTGAASQMMPPTAGPQGPGGAGGQPEITPEMLAQLLQEAGVTPEELQQIEQVLAQQQGGGAGAPEGAPQEGGMPEEAETHQEPDADDSAAAEKDNETSSENDKKEKDAEFVKQFKKLASLAANINKKKTRK